MSLCRLCKNFLGVNSPVKILFCGHSFCSECIEYYHYRRHSPRFVVCPTCGAEMFAPDDKIYSLPINHEFDTVAKEQKIENIEENHPPNERKIYHQKNVNESRNDEFIVDDEETTDEIPYDDDDDDDDEKYEYEESEEDLSTQATTPCDDLVKSDRTISTDFCTVPLASIVAEQ